MKKIVAIAALSCLASSATAADLYAGVKFGSASYGYTNVTNKSQSGSAFFGGYQITPAFAVEAEYAKLGGFDTTSRLYKGSAMSLSGVAAIPMGSQLSIQFKLGLTSTKIEATPKPGWILGGETSHSASGLTLGIAGQYDFTPAVGVRIGVDSYPVGNSNSGTSNVALTSIGGVFKF